MQERRMTMPECVPADPAQSRLLRCRDEPVLLNSAGPKRLSRIRVGKYPAFLVPRRNASQLVPMQHFRQGRVEWHASLGSRRFNIARLSVDVRLTYFQLHTIPIDITLLQAEYFASSQPHTHGDDAHCSKWFGDVFQQFLKLIDRKNGWFAFPLRTILNAHEAHGVECVWDQFPAHRRVK